MNSAQATDLERFLPDNPVGAFALKLFGAIAGIGTIILFSVLIAESDHSKGRNPDAGICTGASTSWVVWLFSSLFALIMVAYTTFMVVQCAKDISQRDRYGLAGRMRILAWWVAIVGLPLAWLLQRPYRPVCHAVAGTAAGTFWLILGISLLLSWRTTQSNADQPA